MTVGKQGNLYSLIALYYNYLKLGINMIISGSNDNWGACSIERFASVNRLKYTHDDANGWLEGCASPINFWMQDKNVKSDSYQQVADNLQDTYGMDAVTAFYHSGHGLNSGGRVGIPMGGIYNNEKWVYSDQMAFGDSELRYLFWSVCSALATPLQSWWEPNKGGLRMMFGYTTTSYDLRNYGTFFWQEVAKGKAFARAFLDASWRVAHSQTPCVMASAATQAEAQAILANEKVFTKVPSVKGWYEWQILQAGTTVINSGGAKGDVELELGNKFDGRKAFKLNLKQRVKYVNMDDEKRLSVFFGNKSKNTQAISEHDARQAAKKAIVDLELDEGIELMDGNTAQVLTCGGTLKGSGTLEEPCVIETKVQFRQVHNGIPSINESHGIINVDIDNDGNVVGLFDSTRKVIAEKKHHKRDHIPSKHKRVIPDRTGIDFSTGKPVYQEDIELDLGEGLKKRYKIRTEL